MAEKIYDVVVIGGGPGGYAAALYCARSGLSVLVIEKMAPGGQMATTGQVDNYPGFDEGIDGFALGERMKRGAERFGAQTAFAEVESVDLRAVPKTIETSDGPVLAHTVALATGASPRELGLPEERGLRGRGISYCATCDGGFFRGKKTAVVGGGNTALEDALFLANLCEEVTLIHRRDEFRGDAHNVKAVLARENIRILYDTVPLEVLGGQQVTGLKVQNKKTGEESELAVDGVFVAVGQIPQNELFRGTVEMDESGFVAAGEDTKTNVPGVFAAGDTRQKLVRQLVTAAADGAVAAVMAGGYIFSL